MGENQGVKHPEIHTALVGIALLEHRLVLRLVIGWDTAKVMGFSAMQLLSHMRYQPHHP